MHKACPEPLVQIFDITEGPSSLAAVSANTPCLYLFVLGVGITDIKFYVLAPIPMAISAFQSLPYFFTLFVKRSLEKLGVAGSKQFKPSMLGLGFG